MDIYRYIGRAVGDHQVLGFLEWQMKELDGKLEVQYLAEKCEGLCYTPQVKYSDDTAIAEMQGQFSHYCLMAKQRRVIDTDPSSMIHSIVACAKQSIIDYVCDKSHKRNPVMECLYKSDDLDLLTSQISILALYANLSMVDDGVDDISDKEIHFAMDPERTMFTIGVYSYFVALVNENITSDNFNELFIEAWIKFFGSVQTRMATLQAHGNISQDYCIDTLFGFCGLASSTLVSGNRKMLIIAIGSEEKSVTDIKSSAGFNNYDDFNGILSSLISDGFVQKKWYQCHGLSFPQCLLTAKGLALYGELTSSTLTSGNRKMLIIAIGSEKKSVTDIMSSAGFNNWDDFNGILVSLIRDGLVQREFRCVQSLAHMRYLLTAKGLALYDEIREH